MDDLAAPRHYELVVLGAGATGLGAARSARQAGRRVALVEKARPGGDCTFYGCIPSKALIETARRVHAARSGPAYGFSAPPEVDFPAVMARVAGVIAEIEKDESPELLAREGIDLLAGWGRFTGPRSLEVDGHPVTFDRAVLATGSRALVPPIEGLAGVPYLDNTTVFALRELPAHMLVLGGGPIGVELAQAFRRLGSVVTVVEGATSLIGKEEPEAQKALGRVLRREGVTVLLGASVVRVSAGPTLHLSDGSTVRGSHLLVAVGRTPSTDGIALETTGATVDRAGRVVVDKSLRAAEALWAAGDCATPLQFTHVGDEQGRLAARNAFAARGRAASWSDRVVPRVTFTEPEVAQVGLTEAQAFAQYGDRAMVSLVPDRRMDRARTAGETDGFTKLIAVRARVGGLALGHLVGMTVVGPMAGEQIGTGALALRARVLLGRLAQTTAAYPTWSMATRIAAARFFGTYGGSTARPARAHPTAD